MQTLFLSQLKVSTSQIDSLKIGDSAKVLIGGKERIWVEVVEITQSSPKKFKGRVDVDPTVLDNVKFGDSISFEAENILDTLAN